MYLGWGWWGFGWGWCSFTCPSGYYWKRRCIAGLSQVKCADECDRGDDWWWIVEMVMLVIGDDRARDDDDDDWWLVMNCRDNEWEDDGKDGGILRNFYCVKGGCNIYFGQLGQVIECSTLGSTIEWWGTKLWPKNGHTRQYLAIDGPICPIWVEHRLDRVEHCI